MYVFILFFEQSNCSFSLFLDLLKSNALWLLVLDSFIQSFYLFMGLELLYFDYLPLFELFVVNFLQKSGSGELLG